MQKPSQPAVFADSAHPEPCRRRTLSRLYELLELYETSFQYICLLGRTAKTQAHPELTRVRAEVKELLQKAVKKLPPIRTWPRSGAVGSALIFFAIT